MCNCIDIITSVVMILFYSPYYCRAFLCVDEPAVKATFSVTLIVLAHHTAISNMPESSCAHIAGGKKKVTSPSVSNIVFKYYLFLPLHTTSIFYVYEIIHRHFITPCPSANIFHHISPCFSLTSQCTDSSSLFLCILITPI